MYSHEKKTVWGNYRGGPRIGQFRTQGGGKGRERERERERERDVGESLLKYSDSRPPKAELHEI